MSPAPDPDPARCAIEASAGHATLVLSGDWTVTRGAPRSAAVLEQLRAQAAREIGFDCSALGSWDSLLVTLRTGRTSEELAQKPIVSPGAQAASQGMAWRAASVMSRRRSRGPRAAARRRTSKGSISPPSRAR